MRPRAAEVRELAPQLRPPPTSVEARHERRVATVDWQSVHWLGGLPRSSMAEDVADPLRRPDLGHAQSDPSKGRGNQLGWVGGARWGHRYSLGASGNVNFRCAQRAGRYLRRSRTGRDDRCEGIRAAGLVRCLSRWPLVMPIARTVAFRCARPREEIAGSPSCPSS